MHFKEYLIDPYIESMSLEAQGILIRLRCLCARDGSIPTNPSQVPLSVGVPLKLLKKYWPDLQTFFEVEAGGSRMFDPGIRKSILEYAEICETKRMASAMGVQTRKNHRMGMYHVVQPCGTPLGTPSGTPNSEYKEYIQPKQGFQADFEGQKDHIQDGTVEGDLSHPWADQPGGEGE